MRKRYTFLLIPPDNRPAKQINFSARGKYWVGVGLLGLGVIVSGLVIRNIYLTSYVHTYQASFAQIDQMKASLDEKDKEIAHLQAKNNEITASLSNIQALETKIAGLLKLPLPRFAPAPSRGGNPTQQSYSINPDSNADLVNKHLALVQKLYDESVKYEDKLAHTPSILPLEGEITSPYGYRKNPFGGWSNEFHDGVDIACNYGTEVHATADGVVTFAGWDPVYGRKVQINHGDGIVTFYGHNSRLLVKIGDKVKKGDIIAYSGNSGRSTGSHLHYGAIVNGKSVDPLMFTNEIKEQ